MSKSNNSLNNTLTVIGGWLSYIIALLYVVLILNANFHIFGGDVLKVLRVAMVYLPMLLIATVGLGYTADKSLIKRVVFLVLLAIIVIFQFMPNTWANFLNIFN